MSEREQFFGDPSVAHLQQPQDPNNPDAPNLGFAAIIAGYANGNVQHVFYRLITMGLARDDGVTVPFPMTPIIPVESTLVTVKPILTPGEGIKDSDRVIEIIDDTHRAGSPVALHYNNTHRVHETNPHWVILSGFWQEDGYKRSVRILDPAKSHQNWVAPRVLWHMIEGSADTTGVHAYSLDKSPLQ